MSRTTRELRRLSVIASALIFLAVFFAYSEALYQEWQREQSLEQIRVEIGKKTDEKKALEELAKYLESSDYEEYAGKALLSRKLPAETVLTFDETKFGVPAAPPPSLREQVLTNLEAWWRYFFHPTASGNLAEMPNSVPEPGTH